MPRDTNYFEEAYELCSHQEPVLALTSKTLYDSMLRMHAESSDEPQGQFNIRYFFLSMAQAISSHANFTEAESTIAQESCAAIKAYNAPSETELLGLRDWHLANTGMIDSYVALVLEQSKDDGDEFDLSYAVRIACEAIDGEAHNQILGKSAVREQSTDMSDSDFDYWLSGFNSEQ